jgi:hypothetical protein
MLQDEALGEPEAARTGAQKGAHKSARGDPAGQEITTEERRLEAPAGEVYFPPDGAMRVADVTPLDDLLTRKAIQRACHDAEDVGCQVVIVSEHKLRIYSRPMFVHVRGRDEQMQRFRPNEPVIRLFALFTFLHAAPRLFLAREPLDAIRGLIRATVDNAPIEMLLAGARGLPEAIRQALEMAHVTGLVDDPLLACVGCGFYIGATYMRMAQNMPASVYPKFLRPDRC